MATSLNNLAGLYREQGKYAEAEPLYQRALKIDEKALGPDHPDVAIRLNNLAELYRAQGKYAAAEPLLQRALKIWEKALGPDHPDVAAILNNLAELYRDQGKHAEAEPLFQRALKIDEKALGPDHPDVAHRLNNLASLYQAQGKYAEAEPLYQRALKIRGKGPGAGTPRRGPKPQQPGSTLPIPGEVRRGRAPLSAGPENMEKALGPDHPDVATGLENYANLAQENGPGGGSRAPGGPGEGHPGQAGKEKLIILRILYYHENLNGYVVFLHNSY